MEINKPRIGDRVGLLQACPADLTVKPSEIQTPRAESAIRSSLMSILQLAFPVRSWKSLQQSNFLELRFAPSRFLSMRLG